MKKTVEMASTKSETLIGNARIVLAHRVIEHGWVAFADGRIAGIGEGDAPAGSEDASGDLIMPGLIELHTDHLEAHYVPRPKVYWNPIAAVVSYDGQLATAGITTVLDSLRVWGETARRMSTAEPACWRRRFPARATPIFCAPIIICTCVAKSPCPTSSRKPGGSSAALMCD